MYVYALKALFTFGSTVNRVSVPVLRTGWVKMDEMLAPSGPRLTVSPSYA